MRYLWVAVGPVSEGRRLLRQALDACPDAPVADRAAAWIGVSVASRHAGDTDAALGAADAALALLDDDERGGEAGARRALGLLVRAVTAFEQQPNGSDELGALYAGAFALALLGAPETAARLHAAVADHAARGSTDPGRYMRLAGRSLEDRVRRLLASLPPLGRDGPMAWAEMVALFTGAAGTLSAGP